MPQHKYGSKYKQELSWEGGEKINVEISGQVCDQRKKKENLMEGDLKAEVARAERERERERDGILP